MIIVTTGPKNFERRDTIRKTWLASTPPDVRHFFPIGTGALSQEETQTLEYENSIHGDLMLLRDLHDSYENLTTKVLKCMTWLDDNVSFYFLLKVDDDTFVRVDVIRSELKEKESVTNLYWGFFEGRANVKKRGKWAEKTWILCDKYLPYARGGGYVLSAHLVHFVAQNSRYLKKYRSEDVSMGVWLAPVDVQRVHDPRFDTEFVSRGCQNTYIVTHKQNVANMKSKYQSLKENGKLCWNEFRTRKSYVYNWDVAPSLCCRRNDSSIP